MFRKFLSIFLFLSASHATATPPDTIFINERLFGISNTHIYFLRTANDNLGLHIFGMKDTYLVAKNIDTRLDDKIWPVMRQHAAPEYDADTGVPTPLIQSYQLIGVVNPFEVLVARGALHIEYLFQANTDSGFTALPENGIVIDEFTLSTDALVTQMGHSVAMTLAAIQPYPDGGFASMTFSSPQDLLGEWTADISQCSQQGDIEISPVYGMRIIHLARIECWDATQEQPASLYVIMDPVIEVEY